MGTAWMLGRFLFLLIVALLTANCGGGDKHLPSSNPPEYDPKKVYPTPAPSPQLAMPSDKPASPRTAVPDPCERPLKKRPDPDEPPTGCSGVSERDERLIVGEGGAGGGGGGGNSDRGGRSERPARPTVGHPSYVLEFKSHIVQSPLNVVNPQFGMQMSSNGFDAHVEATVPLRRRENDGEWVGEGVMHYATRTKTQPASCEIRIQGTGTTTFHVNGGSISRNPDPFAVKLTILPGRSGEVAETHCSRGNTPEKLKELFASQGVQGSEAHGVTEGGGWSSAFNVTRFRTFNMTKKGYEIGGWTPGHDSNVIAKKTITVNCSTGMSTCREETTLTLKLADEPAAGTFPTR